MLRWTLFFLLLLFLPAPLFAATLSFQNEVFPDPFYMGTEDAYITSGSPLSNFGYDAQVRMDGSPADIAGLIKWDVSAIPPGAIVTGATITVNVNNDSSNIYEIYEMKRPWVESQATWNNYATGSPWQTAGASGSLDRGSTVLGSMTGGIGLRTFTLNAAGIALVQNWVSNPAANMGIIIQDYANDNGFAFNSSATGDLAGRPNLTVTYDFSGPPPPPPPPPPPSSTLSFQNGVSPDLFYMGIDDTYITSGSPSLNFGADIQVRMDGSPDDIAGLIKWDVSAIPPNATVVGATITVNVNNNSSDIYKIYEMKRPWVESQATWNNYATGSPWQTAGASGSLDRGSTVLGSMTGGIGLRTYTLNTAGRAQVQSWVSKPATNFGIIIQDYANDDGFAFRSSEDGTPANRPKLSVTYSVAPAPAVRLAFITPPQTTTVGVATGLMTVQIQDDLGNPVNAGPSGQPVFLTSSSTGTVTFTPSASLAIPSGANSVSFTYTDTAVGTTTITASDASPPDGVTGLADAMQQVTVRGFSVSGAVYSDANHNSVKEGAELGLAGVTVQLFAMPSDTLVATQITAADGTYLFNDVNNGDYEIRKTNLAYVSTTPDVLEMTVSGNISNQNFGDFEGVKITGVVFADTGGDIPNNGLKDGSEAGIVGVSIYVTDPANTITYDQTTTGFDGAYTLWIPTSVGMTVVVRETGPANYISITPDTLSLTIAPGDDLSGSNFADVPPLLFSPNGSQTASPGRIVTYAHMLTSGTFGQITLVPQSSQNLSWTFYNDLNENGVLDSGESQLTEADLNLTANQTIKILARAFIPSSLSGGTVDTTTFTATQALTNSTSTDIRIVTDQTTMSAGNFKLIKTSSVTTASPGDTIVYTLTYKNIGTQPLTAIVLYDQLSEYVLFVSATLALDAGFPNATGLLKWTIPEILDAGAQGEISYTVQVK